MEDSETISQQVAASVVPKILINGCSILLLLAGAVIGYAAHLEIYIESIQYYVKFCGNSFSRLPNPLLEPLVGAKIIAVDDNLIIFNLDFFLCNLLPSLTGIVFLIYVLMNAEERKYLWFQCLAILTLSQVVAWVCSRLMATLLLQFRYDQNLVLQDGSGRTWMSGWELTHVFLYIPVWHFSIGSTYFIVYAYALALTLVGWKTARLLTLRARSYFLT